MTRLIVCLPLNSVNPDDSSKNVSKSYQYDEMGRTVRTTVNGHSTTYLYDDLGRVYQEEGYNSFKGYKYAGISQYPTYECSGIFHKIIYYEKNYEYDDEMRISSVQESENDIVSYTYDANGNKKSETLGNGIVSTYTYNKANRITGLENKLGNSAISSYEYSYYLDGSDACKIRNESGIIETTEYEYDSLKRLIEESVTIGSNTDTYSYEYDDYGNRSKMTATGSENYVTEYVYNDTQGNYTTLLQKEIKTVQGENNALNNDSNVKQTVYTYDANGNQIKKVADGKTETNTYDALNQLIGFTDGETTASYKYNVSGLRIEKVVNGQRINHVWDGSKQIVADVIEGDTYNANCYIRGTSLAAKYNYRNGERSEYTYYTQNAHGDVVNLTNADGEIVKFYTYDAFGVEKNISDSDSNPFRYCGEYFDAETGTIYLRARYYNPTTGKFISRDSFAGRRSDPLSLNLYTYCVNNPIIFIDPSGHIPQINSEWDFACYVTENKDSYSEETYKKAYERRYGVEAPSSDNYDYEYYNIKQINQKVSDEYMSQVEDFRKTYKENIDTYTKISKEIDMPRQLIAAIHFRESSCNFESYFQNGDPLGAPTVNEPKGVYCETFTESAIMVLKNEYFVNAKNNYSLTANSRDVASMCAFAETYNGWGYKENGMISPYVFSGTNIYTSGLYVSDRNFDNSFVDGRPGVYLLINSIMYY